MNRSLYVFGILFIAMSLACAIFQNILYLRLDNQMFIQQSFANFFLVESIIGLAGAVFILKYYRYKQYRLAFKTGAIATVLTVCQFIVLYVIIVVRELQNFYLPIAFLLLAAGAVYATSLIFSNAGKRPWLKTAGFFILICSIIIGSTSVGSMLSEDVNIKLMLQKVLKWASVAHPLASVFFIINFSNEIRELQKKKETSKLPKLQESVLNFGALVALVLALFLGGMLSSQSNSFLSWQRQNSEFAKDVSHQYEARTFVDSKGDTTKYQFMKPADYDSQKKYPLILCLHHGGTHGTDNVSQLGADPAPFLSSNKNKYQAFFLMPQCPKGLGWGNVDTTIFEIIQTLEDEFEIDETRRYVMGVSGGGYGSWHFITARPKMFAAAIPICGGGDPKLAAKIVDVPIWAFHGEKDNLVPVRFSQEMIDAIKKAGGNPKYTEFPDAGHNIWGQAAATPDLMDWLFAQKRNSLQ